MCSWCLASCTHAWRAGDCLLLWQCRRLLERHPQIVLDVDTFAQTLAEAKRMLPDQDIMHTLAHNPNMIFGFERRGSMIPYDS